MNCDLCRSLAEEFVDREMEATSRRTLEHHLEDCSPCRRYAHQIRSEMLLYRSAAPTMAVPADLWPSIQARIHQPAGIRERAKRYFESLSLLRRWQMAVPAMGVIVMGVVGGWLTLQPHEPEWFVNDKVGELTASGEALLPGTRLPDDEWLETDRFSRVDIRFDGGHVTLEPGTRLRLASDETRRQVLQLDRGAIRATVVTPPATFRVRTPLAEAVDLGCSFTLTVGPSGATVLHVASGAVGLKSGKQESYVPRGGICMASPQKGLGVPYLEDASTAFRRALDSLPITVEPPEFKGAHFWIRSPDENEPDDASQRECLSTLLKEARPRDSLTLWHLLPQVSPQNRATLVARLAQLSPPPPGVSHDQIVTLDRSAMRRWEESLKSHWS